MKKVKILIYFLIFVILVNISIPVFADNEQEEASLTQAEIKDLLETGTDLEKEPKINARNAVIYDRASRESDIWKKGKYKMQDGINNKNNELNCGIRKCKKLK